MSKTMSDDIVYETDCIASKGMFVTHNYQCMLKSCLEFVIDNCDYKEKLLSNKIYNF